MHNNFVYDYVFFFPFFKLRSVWQIEPFWNTHQWLYRWVSQHLNMIGYYRYMIFKNTFFLWLNVAYCLFGGGNKYICSKRARFFLSPSFHPFLAHLSLLLKWAFLITCRPSSVCLSIRPSVRPSVCNLFTFSSSSPEPLGQFQPNMAQSILEWREFKFVQLKGPALFQGEIIMKLRKYNEEFWKSSSKPLSQFQPNLAQSSLS